MKRPTQLAALLAASLAVAVVWAAETAPESKQNASTQKSSETKTSESKETKPDGPAVPIELEDIHNTFRLGRKIISGACPVGEAGYRALAAQGVKTILSVDGARPDEAIAKKYGMRYVHIPITYAGMPRAQSLAIARVVRDLPGPVFIHCHHGKHRGPTAAVIAAMVNEGWSIEQAQGAMKQAGTSPNYAGLWNMVRDWKNPTPEELDKADATFPASAPVAATAAAMVEIDERWEHLGEVRDADWGVPPHHPDIDPPHEALLLKEHFRELKRSPESRKLPADYMQKLAEAELAAAALEAALRGKDPAKAQDAFKAISQSCRSCHVAYRDTKKFD